MIRHKWKYFLIILLIPVIIAYFIYNVSYIESTPEINSGWLSFWGAYIGGIATLLTVYFTVKKNFDLAKYQKVQEIFMNNINVTYNLRFTDGKFNNEPSQIHTNYEPIRKKREELIKMETATTLFLEVYAKEKLAFGDMGHYLNTWDYLIQRIQFILDLSDDYFKFFQLLTSNNNEIQYHEKRMFHLKEQLSTYYSLKEYPTKKEESENKIKELQLEIESINEIIKSIDQKQDILRKMNSINKQIENILIPEVELKRKELEDETNKLLARINKNHI